MLVWLINAIAAQLTTWKERGLPLPQGQPAAPRGGWPAEDLSPQTLPKESIDGSFGGSFATVHATDFGEPFMKARERGMGLWGGINSQGSCVADMQGQQVRGAGTNYPKVG